MNDSQLMKKLNKPPKPVQIESSKTSLFTPNEAPIEDYLRKRCDENDIMHIKLLPSTAGIPDEILISNGKVVFVETKAPKKKPRPLQAAIIKKMKQHGAIVHVADTKPLVDKVLKKEYGV